ncbi:VanZ family protein [Actinopolymorpha sp. NPDC004070]|uniref:VanZ family protein n=1 Tax=Actinopolymorpha sp. NPDC004070 TaxID=3154548 RepID=UPI0033B7D85F
MRRLTGVAGAAWWAAFALACVLNLYGLYAPNEPGPDLTFSYADKVAHFATFASVAFTGAMVGVPVRWLAGILALHAASSEIIQGTLLPHREGDPFDVLADLAGVTLGLALAVAARRVRRQGGRSAGKERPAGKDLRTRGGGHARTTAPDAGS